MKTIRPLLALLLTASLTPADEYSDKAFSDDLEKIEAKYRASKAQQIRKADRVMIYLVDFSAINKKANDPFAMGDDVITISSSIGTTTILKSKELDQAARTKLLNLLADQMANPKHGGGETGHFPTHGIRVYSSTTILHEGTFCWMCKNFYFTYPKGSSWLDTTPELKEAITGLMPIPRDQFKRLSRKFHAFSAKEENK